MTPHELIPKPDYFLLLIIQELIANTIFVVFFYGLVIYMYEEIISELVKAQDIAINVNPSIADDIEDLIIKISMTDPSPEDEYGDPISNYNIYGHI